MAAVVANVLAVELGRQDDIANGAWNAAFHVKCAKVYVDNNVGGVTPTQVAGGTDTLDCNLVTAIQNATRNGKTVTIRGVPQVCQVLQNSVLQFAGTTTISVATVSISPVTNNWSSNATITAVAATIPYGISVCYTEA